MYRDNKSIILSMFIMSALLLCVAFCAYYILVYRRYGAWEGLFPWLFNLENLLWLCVGCIGLTSILLIFKRCVPRNAYYIEAIEVLAKQYSLKLLSILFIWNAFSEELLFRGALQIRLGILPATILFTLIHFSYFSKPILLLNVFFTGLFLGFLYAWSDSLWICTFSHAFYNLFTVWLIKSGRMAYSDSFAQDTCGNREPPR